ncbi:MAG: minichromosome maintenance protein MCM [Thaumarchaeota archaeon]|nr:minichromosome maintenance protein MCM [Nitrososphaerota archaeon]
MALTQSKLAEQLESFLKGFKERGGASKYRNRVSEMPASATKSVVVDYDDLAKFDVELGEMIIQKPDDIFPAFKSALYEALRTENASYAESIRRQLAVRVRSIPETIHLRLVTSEHLDRLIAVTGMVVRASELKPMAVRAAFACRKCGNINMVEQDTMLLKRPSKCEQCDEVKRLELDEKRTEFIDYQVLRLQELPEELPPGQLPQYFDIDLVGDTVNAARPGDRVNLTGIVRAEAEYSQSAGRLRIFRSRIDANYVQVIGREADQIQLTREDEDLIKRIARRTEAYQQLITSISPSIHGFETQKEAILLQMVSAPQKTLPDGTTIRGDINVLMVGDPGTAKSELLKYSARIAPRGLYTSGRGSTAAGLTAAVVREKNGMMMLEAGAVVLADQGVACIDEFDKMRTEDRNALHECMEQQTCSVAKGGIVATLNARTSILAASNPVLGKYDPFRNISDNVNLPIPLLTRFDLIFVVRDVPDRASDERVAKHILTIHRKGTFASPPPLDFDVLRKYLIYSKKVEPVITKEAEERILEYYLQMRGVGSDNMITVTPRQLEALIRLATARARLLLREKVTEDDALHAIGLMRRMLETVGVDVKSGKVDMGVFHGKPLSERNLLETALDIFKTLEGAQKNPVDGKVFVQELVKTGRFTEEDAKRMLNSLYRSGQIYEVKTGFYRKI